MKEAKANIFSDEKSTVVEVYVFEMDKSRRGLAFPPLPLMAAFAGLCHIKTRVLPAENQTNKPSIKKINMAEAMILAGKDKNRRGMESCLLHSILPTTDWFCQSNQLNLLLESLC